MSLNYDRLKRSAVLRAAVRTDGLGMYRCVLCAEDLWSVANSPEDLRHLRTCPLFQEGEPP